MKGSPYTPPTKVSDAQVALTANIAPRKLDLAQKKVCFVGDSITVGVTNNNEGSPASFRGVFHRLVRQYGDDVKCVGAYIDPPFLGGTYTKDVYQASSRYFPVEPRHEGVSGRTIQGVASNIVSEMSGQADPDIFYILIGTNNCAADSAGTMATRYQAMLTTIRTQWPNAYIVGCTIPHVLVANEATRVAFNANLSATIAAMDDAKMLYLDTCSDFTKAEVGVASGVFDGHPNIYGYNKIGKKMYEHFRSLYPIPSGLKWPRPVLPRQPQASVSIVGALDAINITDQTMNVGSGNFYFAFDITVQTMPASGELLAIGGSQRSYGNGGAALVARGEGNECCSLLMYTAGNGPIIAFGALRRGVKSRIVAYGDAATGIISTWKDGVQICNNSLQAVLVPFSWTWPLTATTLSFGCHSGVNALPALYSNIEAGCGSSVPGFDSIRPYIEADFAEHISIPGRVLKFLCDENTGTTLHNQLGGGTPALNYSTVAWVNSTAYTDGKVVKNDTAPIKAYVCTVAGTSAGSGGPTGRGSTIVDGSVTWQYLCDEAAIGAFNASAGSTHTIGGGSATWGNEVDPNQYDPQPVRFLQTGTVTANGATGVDVTCPNIETSSMVFLTLKTKGGTPSAMPQVVITVAGDRSTSKFTLTSYAGDTSIYNYVVL